MYGVTPPDAVAVSNIDVTVQFSSVDGELSTTDGGFVLWVRVNEADGAEQPFLPLAVTI